MSRDYRPIIVLDDDPTGTQTVHGVPVITEWSIEAIEKEFRNRTPLFYILTNSRALISGEANLLAFEIGQNLVNLNQNFWIISRGDSTLRGHFPNEIEALANGLGWKEYLMVLIPAFFEGNRLTKDDTHYLIEDNKWIPVGETPYAQDKTFGYRASNLKEWVEEKTKGKIKANEVTSVSIEDLENDNDHKLLNIIDKSNKVLIVNALNKTHLDRFTKTIKQSNRKIIFRTGASFVASFGAIPKRGLLEKYDFESSYSTNGGLIVVGSHVPKSTAQLNELLKHRIKSIEFEIEQYLQNDEQYLKLISVEIHLNLTNNQDVVLFTSRNLKMGRSKDESLKISLKISEGLISIVRNLEIQPRFFIAKGGITSSDLATKGLGVKKALVLGQIYPGIPVWRLNSESKFPNMNYIVFPGNVGEANTLLEIYEKLR